MFKNKFRNWIKRREQSLMWDRTPDSIYMEVLKRNDNRMTR